jgi:two-component system sensor histidine kinase KdpD
MIHLQPIKKQNVKINQYKNHYKYNAVAAHINVSASVQGSEIQVEVMDDGPGVPKGLEHLIFEKFYRAQAEGPVSGTGLGLAICKAVIEAHDGRIWTESRPAGGAVFSMRLPLAPAPKEDARDQVA